MNQLLIENIHTLATFDDKDSELSQVDVLINENVVAAIGHNLRESEALPPDVPFIDGRGHLAMPGLVNVHHHLFQVFTRSIPPTQNAELFEWLTTNYEIWKALDPEAIHLGALTSLAELMLSGCTTSSDMHYLFPIDQPIELIDATFDAARDLGLRFHPTRGSMTLGVDDGGLPPMALIESPDRVLEDYERLVSKYHDTSPGAMTRLALAPCAPFNAKEELFKQTVEIADRHDLQIHTHLAETEDENVYCLEKFGCRPLEYVCRLGWETPRAWFAHCVKLSAEEIDRCAEVGMGVAHCPSANARLGSGVAPIPEMLTKGVRVGIGVDGSSSADCGNIIGESRLSLMLHRATGGVNTMKPKEALRMATRGGAEILRNDGIGRIAKGSLADMILINLERLEMAGGPYVDPIAGLAFCGLNGPVDWSIINGKVVVERGKLCRQTEQVIARRANEMTEGLLEKRYGLDWKKKLRG